MTADRVGVQTGGGIVTHHESLALKELGPCEVWGREFLEGLDVRHGELPDPWKWDLLASGRINERTPNKLGERLKLAHFYAGTFGYTVENLRGMGVKVTYTAAAHDVALSRQAHLEMGLPYDFPHLTEPDLLKRYLSGYLAADVLICPSTHSAEVMRGFGATNRIEVIPHGVDLPKCRECKGVKEYVRDDECGRCNGLGIEPVAPMPYQFCVGYLGALGPDKGLRYLLEAWKRLNWKDATLVIGGRDSASPFMLEMIGRYGGGGNIRLLGWVDDVSTFYDQISCYVQPSVTEGFGIEILEAMAHGRAVLGSTGAGAVDLVPNWYQYKFDQAGKLASKISQVRNMGGCCGEGYPNWRGIAKEYTWDKIRARYAKLWQE